MAFDPDYSQEAWSAESVVGEKGVDNSSSLEEQRKAEAAAAGVQDARHIDYAEVLSVYANRSDVETLADRRARELATDPGQQSFTRAAEYDAFAGTTTDPLTQYPADGGWAEEDHTPADDAGGGDGGGEG